MENISLTVFYLARYAEGLTTAIRFLNSLKKYPIGVSARLIVIAKGWPNLESVELALGAHLPDAAEIRMVSDQGLDVDTYWMLGRSSETTHSLFLNSFSELLIENWGELMLKHVGKRRLVGATGNWESAYSGLVSTKSAISDASHVYYFARIMKMRLFWPKFPNAHLRTNAFIVPRELFFKIPTPRSDRYSALLFESGRFGMSSLAKILGYSLIVAGRDGCGYVEDEWFASNTFRSNNQINLLITDNRTRDYMLAGTSRRRELEFISWGVKAVEVD